MPSAPEKETKIATRTQEVWGEEKIERERERHFMNVMPSYFVYIKARTHNIWYVNEGEEWQRPSLASHTTTGV